MVFLLLRLVGHLPRGVHPDFGTAHGHQASVRQQMHPVPGHAPVEVGGNASCELALPVEDLEGGRIAEVVDYGLSVIEDGGGVGVLDLARTLPPGAHGAKVVALGVDHDHAVGARVEDVQVALVVEVNRANAAEGLPVLAHKRADREEGLGGRGERDIGGVQGVLGGVAAGQGGQVQGREQEGEWRPSGVVTVHGLGFTVLGPDGDDLREPGARRRSGVACAHHYGSILGVTMRKSTGSPALPGADPNTIR